MVGERFPLPLPEQFYNQKTKQHLPWSLTLHSTLQLLSKKEMGIEDHLVVTLFTKKIH